MKATVVIDIEPKHAKSALGLAGFGFEANGKTDREICEMAIKMNKCYGVKTESIVWEDEGKNYDKS